VQALEDKEPDRILYLAVPVPFIQKSLKRHSINLVTYDPNQEEIKQWINCQDTAK
jgi:hypothetical protein